MPEQYKYGLVLKWGKKPPSIWYRRLKRVAKNEPEVPYGLKFGPGVIVCPSRSLAKVLSEMATDMGAESVICFTVCDHTKPED